MESSNLEIKTYTIPLPEPVEAFASGLMKDFDLVICKIKNDYGIEGIGYITVHENHGQAIETIIKNGYKQPPEKSGHRIVFDFDKLKKYLFWSL